MHVHFSLCYCGTCVTTVTHADFSRWWTQKSLSQYDHSRLEKDYACWMCNEIIDAWCFENLGFFFKKAPKPGCWTSKQPQIVRNNYDLTSLKGLFSFFQNCNNIAHELYKLWGYRANAWIWHGQNCLFLLFTIATFFMCLLGWPQRHIKKNTSAVFTIVIWNVCKCFMRLS